MLALRTCTTAEACLRILPISALHSRSTKLLRPSSITDAYGTQRQLLAQSLSPYTLTVRHSSFTPSRFQDYRPRNKKDKKETIRHKAITPEQAQKRKEKAVEKAKRREKKAAQKLQAKLQRKEKRAKKIEKIRQKEKTEQESLETAKEEAKIPPKQQEDGKPQGVSRVRREASQDVYPIIAVVGRPNVGKSTLFNRLAFGDKRALIADVAGTTRDRDYASCRWYGRDLIVVDTGGIVGESSTKGVIEGDKQVPLAAMVREQAIIAINEASTIVFVLNIHEGVTPHDLIIARMLRRRKKHVVLVVNKADNQDLRDFYFEEHKVEYIRLGFGEPIVTSAIHGEGFLAILDRIVAPYPETPEEDLKSKEIRIAIVGQPNAGKSSLLNKITGEERAVVSPIAGTTADPVDTLITWRGTHRVRLIDTAGIWRRAKDALARAAVIWALRVIQRAHVVILVIDGTVGVTEHDKHVAGFVVEHMKSVVVAVNKWDLYPKLKREQEEEKPAKDKMSHYQWLMHAKDFAAKVLANDKAGMAAWEKGKGGNPGKLGRSRDKHKELPPGEESVAAVQEETSVAAVQEEEPSAGAEVVKRGSKEVGEINQLTKELLEADEKQEKKKSKKGKQDFKVTPTRNDNINFDALEKDAEEFDIPLDASSSTEVEQDTNSEAKENKPRAKKHKATNDEMVYEEAARSQLCFLPYVPVSFISATTGYRVPSLMDLAVEVFHERGKRIKTQDVFEVLRTAALRHRLPGKGKNLLRVRFATQVNAYPPTFVFFVNNPEVVQQHYEKFLEACIREKYQYVGTPIRLLFKKNSNKYTQN